MKSKSSSSPRLPSLRQLLFTVFLRILPKTFNVYIIVYMHTFLNRQVDGTMHIILYLPFFSRCCIMEILSYQYIQILLILFQEWDDVLQGRWGGVCSTSSLLHGLTTVSNILSLEVTLRCAFSTFIFAHWWNYFCTLNSQQWNSWSISQHIHIKKIHSIKSNYFHI